MSKNITRSQWYTQKIDEFIESAHEETLRLSLYSSEIKRIINSYPNLKFRTIENANTNSSDKRIICEFTKRPS